MKFKRILNVGCGDRTEGTDFIDLNPRRPEVIKCNVDEDLFPYSEETFDKIICRSLLEHIRNPGRLLDECYRVLKKDGEIELETDNAAWFNAHKNSGNLSHYGGYDFLGKKMEKDYHYSLFTFVHVKDHLEKAGFKKVKSEPWKRDNFGWKLELIIKILNRTSFKWMNCGQIKASGVKLYNNKSEVKNDKEKV